MEIKAKTSEGITQVFYLVKLTPLEQMRNLDFGNTYPLISFCTEHQMLIFLFCCLVCWDSSLSRGREEKKR